jgi:hypothetical protein
MLAPTFSPIKLLALAAVVLALLAASGCPLLMIGSLGYEGYQYDKTGKLPGMPPDQSSAGSSAHPTASKNTND